MEISRHLSHTSKCPVQNSKPLPLDCKRQPLSQYFGTLSHPFRRNTLMPSLGYLSYHAASHPKMPSILFASPFLLRQPTYFKWGVMKQFHTEIAYMFDFTQYHLTVRLTSLTLVWLTGNRIKFERQAHTEP